MFGPAPIILFCRWSSVGLPAWLLGLLLLDSGWSHGPDLHSSSPPQTVGILLVADSSLVEIDVVEAMAASKSGANRMLG